MKSKIHKTLIILLMSLLPVIQAIAGGSPAAAASDIYSQDGLGFSGIVEGHPIESDAVMSGYNNWPDGFTYVTRNGEFVGGVHDGENIWMIPYNADRPIKVNKATGAMTGYNAWPAGFTKSTGAFIGAVFDGQSIWMIPYNADRVIKIDKDTGEMTGYNAWPSGFTKSTGAFVGAVFDGQSIWMIPYNADRVIKLDKDTGGMTGYNTWPSGFTKGGGSFAGGIYDGQNIWMIPSDGSHVIKVDKATGAMTGYNTWPSGFTKGGASFVGAAYDGQSIWMVPLNADRVIRIDTSTGAMTGYNTWPAGFTKGSAAFQGGVYDGQSIWLVPFSADRMVQIDKDTGAMTDYNTWPSGFVKESAAFRSGVYDGKSIWLIPYWADRLIKFGPITAASGLTVTTSDPTGAETDGKTKVHVAETAGTGNSFKYKNFASSAVTAPIVGDSIGTDYTALPSDGLITAADGDMIAVVEVNADSKALRFGQAAAKVAADPVLAPAADPASGAIVANNSSVRLTTGTAGATIYYTTDGTTPTASSSSGTSVSITGAPGAAVTLKAIAVKAGSTNSAMMIATYTITPTLKGDANGDGKLTAADALIIYKYIQGKITLTSDELQALDMNDDHVVNALDAEIIMKMYTNSN